MCTYVFMSTCLRYIYVCVYVFDIGLAQKFVRLRNTLFNKVLGENEKCVFHFYVKNRRNLLANRIIPPSLFLYKICYSSLRTSAWFGPWFRSPSVLLIHISLKTWHSGSRKLSLINFMRLIFPQPCILSTSCTFAIIMLMSFSHVGIIPPHSCWVQRAEPTYCVVCLPLKG